MQTNILTIKHYTKVGEDIFQHRLKQQDNIYLNQPVISETNC